MKNINKVTLIGRLTAAPEMKETKTGVQVTTMRVATNYYYKSKDGINASQAEFHDVTCWGKLAEVVCDHLKVGAAVYVEGRIRTNSWEKEDGQKQYKKEIIARTVNFLDAPKKKVAGLEENEVLEEITA